MKDAPSASLPQLAKAYLAMELPLKGLRAIAASLIARYATEAATSGVPMSQIDLYPGLVQTPHRLAKRFRLGDWWVVALKLAYDKTSNRNLTSDKQVLW
jgi:hypothetical protein